MSTYPIYGSKIIDYSDVTYGILRVNRSEIANFLPTLYYPITVHDNAKNKVYNKHMHLSVRNRIDGFTEIYKDNDVKEGDSIIMELHKEYEDGNPKYILNVSFKKNEIISNDQNKRQQRDEELRNELQEEIRAIQGKIKECGAYFDSNETNVRAELVERILNVIGWNFPCLAREVKAGEGNQKVDIVLYDGVQKREKCYALIETKAIDESFDKKDLHKYRETETPYGQLTRYIKYFNKTKPVPIGILTNGQTWIVYRYNWRTETLQEMRRIDIDSKDISKVTSFFYRLRKENFDELINELIEEVTIEEQSFPEFNDSKHNQYKMIIKYEDGTKIEKTSDAEVFRCFIKKHFDEIKKIPDEQFVEKALSRNPHFRHSRKSYIVIKGERWCINTDNETREKMKIIQLIISKCGIPAKAYLLEK